MSGATIQAAFRVDSVEASVLPDGDVLLSFEDDGDYWIPKAVLEFLIFHVIQKWARGAGVRFHMDPDTGLVKVACGGCNNSNGGAK